MGLVCAFFGHRDVFHCDGLDEAIRRAIHEYGADTFWVGGYGSFDRLAAGCVQRLKREYPHIRLLLIRAYLPRPGETLAKCYDSSIYPEGLETVPQRFAISKRNRWITQNCDMVIAYVRHEYGGAYQVYRNAVKRGIPVINLAEGKTGCIS